MIFSAIYQGHPRWGTSTPRALLTCPWVLWTVSREYKCKPKGKKNNKMSASLFWRHFLIFRSTGWWKQCNRAGKTSKPVESLLDLEYRKPFKRWRKWVFLATYGCVPSNWLSSALPTFHGVTSCPTTFTSVSKTSPLPWFQSSISVKWVPVFHFFRGRPQAFVWLSSSGVNFRIWWGISRAYRWGDIGQTTC